MEIVKKLEAGQSYIITHVGNNNEAVFKEQENCRYFASLIDKHIRPIADIKNCVLEKNRLEIHVQLFPHEDIPERYRKKLSQPFSNLFNSYTKAFNKRYGRTGSLFRVRFRREAVMPAVSRNLLANDN